MQPSRDIRNNHAGELSVNYLTAQNARAILPLERRVCLPVDTTLGGISPVAGKR